MHEKLEIDSVLEIFSCKHEPNYPLFQPTRIDPKSVDVESLRADIGPEWRALIDKSTLLIIRTEMHRKTKQKQRKN